MRKMGRRWNWNIQRRESNSGEDEGKKKDKKKSG